MTADIYRNGKSCDMRWGFFYIYRKTGLSSAEALRAYSKLIYPFKHFFLKLCIKRLGISYAYASAKRFFAR